MFEDSLVESRVDPASASKRWTALAAFSLQFAIAAIVIALPLLHPESLRFSLERPMVLPLLPKPPLPMAHIEPASAASTSIPTPKVVQTMAPLLPGRDTVVNQAPALAPIGVGMRMQAELPAGIALGEGGSMPAVSVAPARAAAGPLHISLGVSQGMLLAPIRPVYPAIAKAAHVEGTVIVEAIISRTGNIESARIVSGPPMLQRAAIDAIQAARYQPYRLNGAATAVETTITVYFHLGT